MSERIPITLDAADWESLKPYLKPAVDKINLALEGESIAATAIACCMAIQACIEELKAAGSLSPVLKTAVDEFSAHAGEFGGLMAGTLATGMRRGVWKPDYSRKASEPV